jgi:hypothetical protein
MPTFYCVDVGLIGNVTLSDNKYQTPLKYEYTLFNSFKEAVRNKTITVL